MIDAATPGEIMVLVAEMFRRPVIDIATPAFQPAMPRRVAIMLSIDLCEQPIDDIARFYMVKPRGAFRFADTVSCKLRSRPRLRMFIEQIRAEIPRQWPLSARSFGRPDIADIKAATCRHTGISLHRLCASGTYSSVKRFARPRQIAIALAREVTDRSTTNIGKNFGDRDHTTVLNAVWRIEQLVTSDPYVAADKEAIRAAAFERASRTAQRAATSQMECAA